MKLTNGEAIVFAPSDEEEREGGARYRLRPASVYDRARWMRAVAARGARYPAHAQLLARAAAVVAELLDDGAERAELLALIERAREPGESGLEPADAARLEALEAELARHDEVYAGLLADRVFWAQVAPIEAFRLFCAGWEGDGLPAWRRGPDGVHEEVLAALPPGHVEEAGWHAVGLMQLGEGARKNSPSPPSGTSAETTSPAASTPRPKPRSTATPGASTPSD